MASLGRVFKLWLRVLHAAPLRIGKARTMSRFTDAISWTGTDVTLILFVIFPRGSVRELSAPKLVSAPDRVRTYEMIDDFGVIGGRRCIEYDIGFQCLPPDIDRVASGWLDSAMTAGGQVAWLTAEGTFSFLDLLTDDVATTVFGVATQEGKWLALDDDYRFSSRWLESLAGLRAQDDLW